jgi:hypothetical protein
MSLHSDGLSKTLGKMRGCTANSCVSCNDWLLTTDVVTKDSYCMQWRPSHCLIRSTAAVPRNCTWWQCKWLQLSVLYLIVIIFECLSSSSTVLDIICGKREENLSLTYMSSWVLLSCWGYMIGINPTATRTHNQPSSCDSVNTPCTKEVLIPLITSRSFTSFARKLVNNGLCRWKT